MQKSVEAVEVSLPQVLTPGEIAYDAK